MSDVYERPRETVPLFQGDDLQRLEELRADLMEAASAAVVGPRLLSETVPEGTAELKAKADAHDDFVREATERARKVEIQALPRHEKRRLQADHPARTVTETITDPDGTIRSVEIPHKDDNKGFNFETMADVLVPASLIGFNSHAAAVAFAEDLSDPHFNAIYRAAIRLNYEDSTVPKAEASSLVDRIIAAISTSPEDSD
jgi:hypothetical protein